MPELEAAVRLVGAVFAPTPQIAWPLLAARTGVETWVKHENHTPFGAFKVRGGLVYVASLRREAAVRGEPVRGLVAATRGNHGQSLAFAAGREKLPVAIVVPHGNSVEKNAATRALGAELIEHGADFDEAREAAYGLSAARGWHLVPSFHPELVRGVATYAWEFFRGAPPLDLVYVPVGLGSGICGVIRVRDLLGLPTRVVGVVSTGAPAYARSFAAGEVVTTADVRTRLADGMGCRVPDPGALAIIRAGVERIVEVSDTEIAAAMRAYHTDTHNLAEGAGAAGLAALLQPAERAAARGRRVGLVLCGGNVDASLYRRVLDEEAVWD